VLIRTTESSGVNIQSRYVVVVQELARYLSLNICKFHAAYTKEHRIVTIHSKRYFTTTHCTVIPM